MREVAFAAGKRRRERNEKISPSVKCCAFDSPLSEGAETAGAKFSEFGHPFVCFADISPNRGITPPYMHTIDFVRRGDSRIARKA